jgi:hypothetical protein
MKNYFIYLLLMICIETNAQKLKPSLKTKVDSINLDSLFFEGIWSSVDSSTCTMLFVYKNNELALQFDENTKYIITKLKKAKNKTIVGKLSRWPMENCIIFF